MASPLTVWSTTADCGIYGKSTTYATARTTAAYVTAGSNTDDTVGQYYSAPNSYCYEPCFSFDTSSIGAGQTVTTATFSLYGQYDGTAIDFTINAHIRNWGATVELADFVSGDDFGSYTKVAHYDTANGWPTNAYTAFANDAFPANVVATGTTYLLLVSSRQVAGNAVGATEEYAQIYMANDATGGGGTDRDPKLYVEWEIPSASPLTVWSTTADNRVYGKNATYTTARSTAFGIAGADNAQNPVGQEYSAPNYWCYESLLRFDTSSIGSGKTVTVATLSLYGQADFSDVEFIVEARQKSWAGAAVAVEDWTAGADLEDLTLLASYDTTSGWATNAYTALASESAFLTNVSLTANTDIMSSSSRLRVGNQPSATTELVNHYSADDATGGGGTGRDPKLYVEWTAGGDRSCLIQFGVC